MKDLQEILNQRASERLWIDIQSLNSDLMKHRDLLQNITVEIGTVMVPEKVLLFRIANRAHLGQQIYDQNINRYIKQQSIEFIEQIKSMQKQINEIQTKTP